MWYIHLLADYTAIKKKELYMIGCLHVHICYFFPFHFSLSALEKEMATHSSILAWRIPGTGGPGGLLSVGSHRVGHDWSDLAAVAARYIMLSEKTKVTKWYIALEVI